MSDDDQHSITTAISIILISSTSTKDVNVIVLFRSLLSLLVCERSMIFRYDFYKQFFSSLSSSLGESHAPPPDVPLIIAEMTGGTVHLRCSFTAVSISSGSSLGHVVAWSRLLGPEGRREELKRETTVQTSALIELDGFNLRLGDKVGSWSAHSQFRSQLLNSQSLPCSAPPKHVFNWNLKT